MKSNEIVLLLPNNEDLPVFPFDTGVPQVIAEPQKRWGSRVIGCRLFWPDGELTEVTGNTVCDDNVVRRALCTVGLLRLRIKIETKPVSMPLSELKVAVIKGLKIYHHEFGSDLDIDWAILKKPIVETVKKLDAANSKVELYKRLELPVSEHCLTNL